MKKKKNITDQKTNQKENRVRSIEWLLFCASHLRQFVPSKKKKKVTHDFPHQQHEKKIRIFM